MDNGIIVAIVIIAVGLAVFAFAFKYLVESLFVRAREKTVTSAGRSGPVTTIMADGTMTQDFTDCHELTIVNLTDDDLTMNIDKAEYILKPQAKYVGQHASGHHDLHARSLNTGRSVTIGFKFSKDDTIFLDFEEGKLKAR
ncbi:MAG: hypothetical protein MJZ38_02260 [archaeon]|nr:hypothetical protein [archaeon]